MPEKTPTMQLFESIHIENAYKKAEKKLEDVIINPHEYSREFVTLYGRAEVEDNMRHAEKLKKEFSRIIGAAEKMGRILEAIIYEEIESAGWLGLEVFTVKTADYDDFENHIDMVAEFRPEEGQASHLAFAIDVTMSTLAIGRKLNAILENIERGKLGTVKFFVYNHTLENQKPGMLEKIPHVVIGVDAKILGVLSALWMENKKSALGKHRVQYMILEEIRMQLVAFERYARSGKVNRPDVAKIFSDARTKVEAIIQKKEVTEKKHYVSEEFMDDRTFAALKEYCDGIGR